jgi:AraC family transcriptional regulator, transcriptional activator of pobA
MQKNDSMNGDKRKSKIIPTHDIYKKIESDLQFECRALDETNNPYDSTHPHRHNYFEIFFFDTNGGFHEIDFQTYNIKKNNLHFISPEQVHLLKRKSSVDGFVLSFTKEFFSLNDVNDSTIDDFPYFNNPSSPPILELKKIGQQKIVFELIGKLKDELHSENEDKANVLRSYLHILLIQLKRMFQPTNSHLTDNSSKNELSKKFKLLVDKNFIQKKSVREYAELLHISVGHLNDTVQATMGKTASDLIHKRIILEAKRLLFHSGQSVKEIAFHLNFEDASYFSRFFKNHTDTTPETFRKQIREKYH